MPITCNRTYHNSRVLWAILITRARTMSVVNDSPVQSQPWVDRSFVKFLSWVRLKITGPTFFFLVEIRVSLPPNDLDLYNISLSHPYLCVHSYNHSVCVPVQHDFSYEWRRTRKCFVHRSFFLMDPGGGGDRGCNFFHRTRNQSSKEKFNLLILSRKDREVTTTLWVASKNTR